MRKGDGEIERQREDAASGVSVAAYPVCPQMRNRRILAGTGNHPSAEQHNRDGGRLNRLHFLVGDGLEQKRCLKLLGVAVTLSEKKGSAVNVFRRSSQILSGMFEEHLVEVGIELAT